MKPKNNLKTISTSILTFILALGIAFQSAPVQAASFSTFSRRGNGFQIRGGASGDLNDLIGWFKKVTQPRELKFQQAVLHNDLPRAKKYFDLKYVNNRVGKGYSPMFYAAIGGWLPMVRMLHQNGASVSQQWNGKSLAYHAASDGHFQTAAALVEMGGGDNVDITFGREVYTENQRQRRNQNTAIMLFAIAAIAIAISNRPTDAETKSYDDQEALDDGKSQPET